MTHRFSIKEIALQAGMSTATIDRALNNRANVSPQTRRRVADAISELEQQETQLSARGRRMFIDVVVEAPARFSREIRTAVEAILATFSPAVIRPRFLFRQRLSEEEWVNELGRIAKRGSNGVCLKARDLPAIRQSITALNDKNIPVVTVFTDIPSSPRLAYAGLDNIAAGRTAAYLLSHMTREETGTVLTTQSNAQFQGEDDRQRGFAEVMAATRPGLRLLDASGGGGLNADTARNVEEVARTTRNLRGIYSMGGGNAAILEVLDTLKLTPAAFIAHDLDEDNLELLRAGRLSAVLHHDLQQDMRSAILQLMAAQRVISTPDVAMMSDVQVITPMNIPTRFRAFS